MTTIVTGSAGFVGRTLVRTLLDAGETVVGIDRAPEPPQPGLTSLTADLVDRDDATMTALATADRVFHLAGCPGVRDARADVDTRRHRDNVLSTAVVLSAVPAATPLVLASSSSVYGGARHGRPSAETDPVRPRGGYAASKVAAERLCRARLDRGGELVVTRLFTVAGEGQRPDMALSQWIEAARAGRPLRLLGSASRTRDVTDVREAARALVALTERGARGAVNVGTGVGHTLRAMVQAVAAALDVDVRTYRDPADPVEVTDTLADTRTLTAWLGWTPETDLPALVARQVAAGTPSPSVAPHPAVSAGSPLLAGT
ncbi:MAG TPA: NAD(P)-dependent oxidoreductase [Cryptosporangiaceae bacterium]|nr:NAD(P)-dependent oxidoreductase [Cryptosporangiaceae bacterium]